MIPPATENRIATLLGVLDEDMRHLEHTLVRLDTLRSLLVKREAAALARLLDDVRRETDAYQANEQKRHQLQCALAAELGCAARELTLSRLVARLSGPTSSEVQRRYGAALAERQTRLRSLASRLKREYTLTTLLVRDCLRFNRALLEIFLRSRSQETTYSAAGVARRAPGAALMDMKL
jgi:flagellar biosynthesis/type III secretory pathway chaperone